MKTIWGETLDPNSVLPEYPRPQMERDSYLNLNGRWEYAITESNDMPQRFDGEILVPFSPESELSGVGRTLQPNQTLWYRRTVPLPDGFNRGRVLLHFGAVDQEATVFLNDTEVCSHVGGYTPFTADVTDCLRDKNILTVRVHDVTDTSWQSRGKQKLSPGGIWYTAQSGIWQTVWMESVPREYISGLRITPLFDESVVELTVISDGKHPCHAQTANIEITFMSNEPVRLPVPGFIPWSPENPHLYDLFVTMGEDSVKSYYGMRKFSVETDERGTKRLFLNNRPYFHTGLLDQGYYCDGLYTAPTDEAMVFDIKAAKSMGFNMLRKHIKIEPLRYYYHCDRLGLLVWQDMVNGGGKYKPSVITAPAFLNIHRKDSRYRQFARETEQGRKQYLHELDETVTHLYNAVCIAMWVPFNEGWGQFDAADAVERLKRYDSTRTIDHASGWYDQGAGDVNSLHVYFRPYHFRPDRLGRAVVLSEFGGYQYRAEGHCFNNHTFGYRPMHSPEQFLSEFQNLYENQIIPAKEQGLSACVYTQLTDVESEVNGLITYDRKVVKLPCEEVKRLNDRLIGR